MKCEELIAYNVVATADVNPEVVDSLGCTEWTGYDKSEVDDAIAELKSENERLNRELEHVKNGDCINTCDVVEKHVKEEIKAKRALWLARAERALEKIAWFKLWNASISTMNPEDGAKQEYDKWKKNLGKFLKKAEEYR